MLIFTSVKIIHKWEHAKEYRLLADYFRLIGVFVCDCTLKREKFSDDFDFVFLLDKDFDKKDIEEVKRQYSTEGKPLKIIKLEELKNVTLNEESKEGKEKLKNYIYECLNKLEKVIPVPDKNVVDKEMKILKEIADIYVKHRLCYYLNMYRCIPNKRETVQKAQDSFVNAYINLAENEPKTSQVYYALANLAKYMNRTCALLGEEFLLETDMILEWIDQALELEPIFDNAYLLKALVTEMDPAYKIQSKIYYENAMERIGKKSYSSYSHYLEGKYYEMILNETSRAKICYTKSLEINKLEYRTLYRLAIIYEKEKEYIKAIEALKSICNILNEPETGKKLQPKEYEYLLKAYYERAKIQGYYLFNKKEYDANVESVRQLLDLKDSSVYEDLFGEEGKEIMNQMNQYYRTILR